MAQVVRYNTQVAAELANAHEKSRAYSPCRDHIEAAAASVYVGAPIYDVMEDIIIAMKLSTNERVLFPLSQAIAWIGPMGE